MKHGTPFDIIVQHAFATLPDSISARKTLLRALTDVMASNHPDYKTVFQMLASIELHEAQQEKLFQRKPRDVSGDGEHKKGDGK